MTWLNLALILTIATFVLFAWALCRIAAQSDERDERLAELWRNKERF